jgi:hypothetical protein
MRDISMRQRSILRASVLFVLFNGGAALAESEGAVVGKAESIGASVCRLIESSARTQGLPVAFLTRLIWRESSFRADVISPAGAQGVAQFMLRTADEHGLADPFDPEKAIPKAAELLVDLKRRFGNLGLAAAYNAGSNRVAVWLEGHGNLPTETRDYVLAITRHPVEDWMADAASATLTDSPISAALSCSQAASVIRRKEPRHFAGSALFAPWGVQLAGNFSKAVALAAYARARSFPDILRNIEPMFIAGRVLRFGFSTYYQIRLPAASRAAANAICEKILRAGGACVVLRS